MSEPMTTPDTLSERPNTDGFEYEPDRDDLGRKVREAWIKWASSQPSPKASWLVPYDDLFEDDKEADRQIGEELTREIYELAEGLEKFADEQTTALDATTAALSAAQARIERLEAALTELVTRLDEVHADPTYVAVWAVSQLHQGPYTGPTYTAALVRARQALREIVDPSKEPRDA